MGLTLWLALQAAVVVPSDFDLAKVKPSAGACARSGGRDIVVCGRLPQVDRFTPEEMAELERRYAEKPVRAATGLGGGAVADVTVSDAVMPDGQVSKRVMAGVKLPF